MMKKLGHIAKPADNEDVKAKKVAEQVKVDSPLKMSSVGSKSRFSLFAKEELHLRQQPTVPEADSEETKTIVEEKAAIPEDEV